MVTYEFQNDAEAIDALAGVNLTIDPEKGIVRPPYAEGLKAIKEL